MQGLRIILAYNILQWLQDYRGEGGVLNGFKHDYVIYLQTLIWNKIGHNFELSSIMYICGPMCTLNPFKQLINERTVHQQVLFNINKYFYNN